MSSAAVPTYRLKDTASWHTALAASLERLGVSDGDEREVMAHDFMELLELARQYDAVVTWIKENHATANLDLLRRALHRIVHAIDTNLHDHHNSLHKMQLELRRVAGTTVDWWDDAQDETRDE